MDYGAALRPVIVHADDFGRDASTTHAITSWIDEGIVSSVSVLANLVGTADALVAAKRLDKRISIGVHLNLCEGWPLTSSPSLVTERGVFASKRAIVRRALLGRLNLQELECELTTQVARIADAGVTVSHFDGHKHLHLLPGIAPVVVRLARRFGVVRIRCPVSSPLLPSMSSTTIGCVVARTYAAKLAEREFRRAGLRHPDRFIDLAHLYRAADTLDRRLGYLSGAMTEVMCHATDVASFAVTSVRALVHAPSVVRRSYWNC
jgi:predicted glycoside hydrolase/deacetylase ChbG (UPF0249 family)